MHDQTKPGDVVLREMNQIYTLEKEDIGNDAKLSRKGMTFETESYRVEGFGHLCILRMNAMLGLMKMETAVLSCTEKDVPLLNLDWVKVPGKETQLIEYYDTQITPFPAEMLAEYQMIRDRDHDLTDYAAGEHWYDEILYPCSYQKTGKGVSGRFHAAVLSSLQVYLKHAAELPACERASKEAKNRAFAQRLFSEGGPAVNQVKSLFGEETARRLILNYMYGG